MKCDLWSARTLTASGRFVWMVWLLVAGCSLAGPATTATPAELGANHPVLLDEPISSGREARAADIFERAKASFDGGDLQSALTLSTEIIEQFPESSVSGRALLLNASALRDSGDAQAADRAAQRYIDLLDAGDGRIGSVRLLQAEAFVADGPSRIDRLLRIPETSPRSDLVRAERLIREAAAGLDGAGLSAVLAEAPANAPLRWVLEVRAGALALEAGDEEAATRFAERALGLGATGPDSAVAEGLRRGELPGGRLRTTNLNIATVLPTGGSPALSDFAAFVAEGVEVAAATTLGDRFRVTVLERDDEGTADLAASIVSSLENQSVAGVIGFLEDDALEAAGRVRRRGLPLISPTARSASRAGDGVYSLEGPDPLAAASMARYAKDRGFLRVAIIHSQAAESAEEADAFQAAMDALGVPVVGRFSYPEGATFFEDQIIGARDALRRAEIAALRLGRNDTLHVELLDPVAVFLPIPREDVEYVAPQVTHYALDTLAIAVLGTSAWTDPQVLQNVDSRHTTGVAATAPVGRETGSPGELRFRQAYERHFRRSLVSPVPAVGYDAAMLLLEALRSGPVAPGAVRSSLERLRDIEGATGVFSVIGGRVVRRTEVVYIDNRNLVPIG